MDVDDLAFSGVTQLAQHLRDRRLSSRELTQLCLDRIARIDPKLNAFRIVWPERALTEADGADLRLREGEDAPLLGVPIAIKDNIDVAGESTTMGTAAYTEPAADDDELVRRLRAAGAVVIGKTNLPEYAAHTFTETATFGITRNPWNTAHTPGGSSGGSAAAVAAGLVPLAHATDGAGSIRIPAALCGLFGLKPQRNRIPSGHDFVYGLSHNGCLSRTVSDSALFLDAVTGGCAFRQAANAEPDRLRIGVAVRPPRPPIAFRLNAEARQTVEETASLLSSLGHSVENVDLEWGSAQAQVGFRYFGGIGEQIRKAPHPDRLERRTRGIERLATVARVSWMARRSLRREAADRQRINEVFGEHDVLLTPLTGPAIEVGKFDGYGALRCALAESSISPFTAVWNYLGNPAASVPAGLSSAGLPLAVQLVGRDHDEATLFSLANQLERERPWAHRRPDL